MSMDNYPQYADVVESDFVQEVCPDKHKKFMDLLEKHDIELEQFAQSAKYDCDIVAELSTEIGSEENAKELFRAFDDLCSTFEEETGLTLFINEHTAEDKGDDVDGAFWHVEGVYVHSAAGEKYKDKIIRKGWNMYG